MFLFSDLSQNELGAQKEPNEFDDAMLANGQADEPEEPSHQQREDSSEGNEFAGSDENNGADQDTELDSDAAGEEELNGDSARQLDDGTEQPSAQSMETMIMNDTCTENHFSTGSRYANRCGYMRICSRRGVLLSQLKCH